MCEPTTIALVATGASTLLKMKGDSDQASYTAGVARNNATMAEYAAADATRRGELEAQRVQRQTSQVVGSQRAGFAAKGLDISDGTPGDIIDQTNFFGKADAATARYNGKVEAWGKQNQANGFRSQASAAEYNGNMAVAGDLISGAGAVADKWYQYGGTGRGGSAGGYDPRAGVRGQRGY